MKARRDAWVFLKGCSETSATGARVELLETGQVQTAGPGGPTGGYAWAVFSNVPHGRYTVRVTFPSGEQRSARLPVDERTHLVTVTE
jgi:hypothetical protein